VRPARAEKTGNESGRSVIAASAAASSSSKRSGAFERFDRHQPLRTSICAAASGATASFIRPGARARAIRRSRFLDRRRSPPYRGRAPPRGPRAPQGHFIVRVDHHEGQLGALGEIGRLVHHDVAALDSRVQRRHLPRLTRAAERRRGQRRPESGPTSVSSPYSLSERGRFA